MSNICTAGNMKKYTCLQFIKTDLLQVTRILLIDAFTIELWWNFDEMQIIFKAITGISGHAFWWEEQYCTLRRTTFDAGLVALESISPGKGTYYGTLRCRTLPSKENFPRQWPAPWFLRQIGLSPVECRTFFPTKGRDQKFLLSLWIRFASHQNSITPRSWKHLYWKDAHSPFWEPGTVHCP